MCIHSQILFHFMHCHVSSQYTCLFQITDKSFNKQAIKDKQIQQTVYLSSYNIDRMKNYFFGCSIAFLLVLATCCQNSDPHLSLKIKQHQYYAHLSSASGVGSYGDALYLVGDDLPWLFKLDRSWTVVDSVSLAEIHPLVNGRTESTIKVDFENLEIFREEDSIFALILSSGSKKVYRDTAFLVSISPEGKKIKRKNIRALYEKIKAASGITDPEEINIEGLAISDLSVYLFHRGNISGNFIVEFERKMFMNYLVQEGSVEPGLEIFKFELPVLNGVPSGFSGACMLPDQTGLLFTASMEDTKTVTEDGLVSGSYVGVIPVSGLINSEYKSILLEENNSVLAKKLEGITVLNQKGNKYNIIAVCDNDNGSSDIFGLELRIQNY